MARHHLEHIGPDRATGDDPQDPVLGERRVAEQVCDDERLGIE